MKDRVLITGVSGFIGFNLYNYLKKKGLAVKGIDNFKTKNKYIKKNKSDKNFINCDILDEKKLKKVLNKFDIIIHLAAIEDLDFIKKYPDYCFKVNFDGTRNIINNLNHKQIFIYFSSNVAYGNSNTRIIHENLTMKPENIYGLSKYLSEKYLIHSSKIKNINYLILRNFTTFGPYQGLKSFIPTLINSLLKKKKIKLFNPKKFRDLQFIDDLSSNVYQLIKKKQKIKNNIFNMASGKPYSSYTIAKKLYAMNNLYFKNEKKFEKLKFSQKVSINKMQKFLKKDFSRTKINLSLKKTFDFYRNYKI